MRKLVFFLLAVVFTMLSGCQIDQPFINEDNINKIGFISETMTVERWQRDRDIFVAKAEELGAEVLVKNAFEDSDRQREIGMEMIEQGVDVLVIVAYDKDSLKELVNYAHNKNVKIIAYDRMIRNANVDLFISFNNYRVGELMGKSATESVPEGNYLILNGSETDNNSFMVNDGYFNFLQPLIDSGGINIMGETWIEAWREELSYEYVSEVLSKNKNINAIIAANDQLAEGAVRALSENRLAGQVHVTGQDAELAACQRIVEGTQSMTVYKPINVLAEGAAEIAVKMAKGESFEQGKSISDGTYEINYIIYDPILVTKYNMNDTVIKDGFYTVEQVYANVPPGEWP